MIVAKAISMEFNFHFWNYNLYNNVNKGLYLFYIFIPQILRARENLKIPRKRMPFDATRTEVVAFY